MDRKGDTLAYPKVIRELPFKDADNTYFYEDDYLGSCDGQYADTGGSQVRSCDSPSQISAAGLQGVIPGKYKRVLGRGIIKQEEKRAEERTGLTWRRRVYIDIFHGICKASYAGSIKGRSSQSGLVVGLWDIP